MFSTNLIPICYSGTKKTIYSFSGTVSNDPKVDYILIENNNSSLFRLSLRAQSSNTSTFIGVQSVYLNPTTRNCDGHTVQPTTVPVPTVSPSQTLNCDFEQNNLCKWSSQGNMFKVTEPALVPPSQKEYMPFRDTTRSSSVGHFAYLYADKVDAVDGQLLGLNAYKGKRICMQFYFFFYASGASKFTLLNDSPSRTALFTEYNYSQLKWRLAKFTLNANETNFNNFIFSATVQNGTVLLICLKANYSIYSKVCSLWMTLPLRKKLALALHRIKSATSKTKQLVSLNHKALLVSTIGKFIKLHKFN